MARGYLKRQAEFIAGRLPVHHRHRAVGHLVDPVHGHEGGRAVPIPVRLREAHLNQDNLVTICGRDLLEEPLPIGKIPMIHPAAGRNLMVHKATDTAGVVNDTEDVELIDNVLAGAAVEDQIESPAVAPRDGLGVQIKDAAAWPGAHLIRNVVSVRAFKKLGKVERRLPRSNYRSPRQIGSVPTSRQTVTPEKIRKFIGRRSNEVLAADVKDVPGTEIQKPVNGSKVNHFPRFEAPDDRLSRDPVSLEKDVFVIARIAHLFEDPFPLGRRVESTARQLPVHEVRLFTLAPVGLHANKLGAAAHTLDFEQGRPQVVDVEVMQRVD